MERRTFRRRKNTNELLVHGEAHTALAIKVPPELHKEIRTHCAAAGISMLKFITEAIRERLGGEHG